MSKVNPLDTFQEDPKQDEPMLRAREYEQGTVKSVRTLGKAHKINVAFAGDEAKTNKEMVVLPKLADDAVLTKRQVGVGRGYADHETAHQLMTDFDNFLPAVENSAQRSPLLSRFMQGLEDIRIEKGMQRLYPGVPDSISKTADYAARHFLDTAYRNDPTIVDDFRKIGPIATTWAGRKRLGYDSPLNNACLDLLSPEMRQKVDQWVDAIMDLQDGVGGPGEFDQDVAHQGCRDGMQLAQRFVDEVLQEPPPQPEGNDGKPKKQGGQGNGKGKGKAKGKADGDADEEDDTPSGGDQGDDGDDEEDGEGGGGDDGDDDDGDEDDGSSDDTSDMSDGGAAGSHHQQITGQMDYDPTQVVDPNLDGAVAKLMTPPKTKKSKGGWRTFSFDEDAIHGSKGRKPVDVMGNPIEPIDGWEPDGAGLYRQLLTQNAAKLGAMKRKFEKALITQQSSEWEGRKRRGRLDRRGLTRVATGSKQVFRQKVEGEVKDAAVTITVDLSGSMSGPPLLLATQACIALAEVLDRGNIALEVAGWGYHREFSKNLYHALRQAEVGQTAHYIRRHPVDLYLFKAFEDQLKQRRAWMGQMAQMAHGGTPDGPGILMAGERLLMRPESKKIMLNMMDGGSGWGVSNGYFKVNGPPRNGHDPCLEYTRDVINTLEKQGVHMIGLGIMHEDVRKLFKKYVVVNDLDDLSKGVLDQVAKMILGEQFTVDNADLVKASGSRVRAA